MHLTTRYHSPRALRAGLAIAAAFSAASLFAQTTPTTAPAAAKNDGEQPITLEAVKVTGSNISRMDVEKVLPVSQFSTDAINTVQALEPINLILALPTVTGVPSNEAATGGAGQRGDISTVNMRGIGPAFTLLLVDGYRLAPHPIITTDNFSPNGNQFPNFGIDHVDVLRDGASSIYGTDAVAGVVNYVMKRDRQGSEARFRVGVPQHGGGRTVEGTVATGRDLPDGKGHFTATLDFMYRDALFASQRSFSAYGDHSASAPAPFNVATSAYNGLGSNPIWAQFYIGSGGLAQYQVPIVPTGAKINYFYPVASATANPTITQTAPTKPGTPWYYENLNSSQMILPRTARFSFFSTIDHDVVGSIKAFGDISYYHATTNLERQPQSLAAPGSDYYKVVSANNPFNPYGSSFYSPTGAGGLLVGTPQPLTLISRELIEMGNEHIVVTDGVYRLLGGLRGKISDTWSWEFGALYTRASAKDLSHETRESALATALNGTTTATAYNPFGYNFAIQNGAVVATTPYTNPASVVQPFVQEWDHWGFTSIGSLNLKTSGQLLDLWSGPWSAAAGGEYRRESFGDHRPDYAGLNPPSSGLDPLNNDFITASPKPDSEGSRNVTSGYAETVLPLVAPKNQIFGVNSLETSASVRFEKYSDFGNTTRPKVGINYKPVDWLMIRASFNEGFSAPVLPLVFYPTQFSVDTQPGTSDPYYGAATGITQYVAKNQTNATKLLPSTSIGRGAGIVINVPFIKRLSITADYWQIGQDNLVGTLSASQIMSYDQTVLNAYTQSQLAAGVNINNINTGSGTSAYKGSPFVVRYAPSAAELATFAAYNATKPAAQQEAAVGQVNYRIGAFQNFAKAYVDGWDFNVKYDFPKTEFGSFRFSTDWTYLMRSYYISNVPGVGEIFQDRMNQTAVTRWKGTSTLTWRKGSWEANVGAFFVGRFAATNASTTAATYAALGNPDWIQKTFSNGSYNYWPVEKSTTSYNLGVSHAFAHQANAFIRDTTVRLGVINVFDLKPPLAPSNIGFDTSAYLQTAIGRQFTFEMSRQF
jgi:outer membrane receptor protein involved in Fe transport